MKCFFSLITIYFLSLTTTSNAHQQPEPSPVEVNLISEVQTIQPGIPFTVAFEFKLKKHWHIYWKNPGDSGLEPSVNWTLPEGFQAGPIQWPVPKKISLGEMVNFGYEDSAYFLVEITPPSQLKVGQKITLEAQVEWLVCKEECLSGSKDLALALSVSQKKKKSSVAHRFARAREKMPKSLSEAHWEAQAFYESKTQKVLLKLIPVHLKKAPEKMQFFPEQIGLMRPSAKQEFQVKADSLHLIFRVESLSEASNRLKGILMMDWSEFSQAVAVDIKLNLDPRQR